MPHVRVDLHESHRARLPEYSEAILAGMVRGLGMPEFDLFQSFRLHQPGEIFFSRTFPGVQRDDMVLIELVAQVGYTDEQKQAGMAAVVEELEKVGVPRGDVMVLVVEVQGAAWYPLPTPEDVAAEG